MTDTKKAGLRKIRLELARQRGAAGLVASAPAEAYDVIAPLDANAHIDIEEWRRHRALCFVHRVQGGMIAERGVLAHRAGGLGGATWVFHYEPDGPVDEDAGFRFGDHAFTVGEYVSIRDEDGGEATYRVASVDPA